MTANVEPVQSDMDCGGDAAKGAAAAATPKSDEWEEPHPGQRLSCPTDTTTDRGERTMAGGVGVPHAVGVCRGDMTAKGYGLLYRSSYPPRQWLPRRHARIKIRKTALLKPLTIPTRVPEEADTKAEGTAPPPRPSYGVGATAPGMPVLPPLDFGGGTPIADAAQSLEVDTDAESDAESATEVATAASICETDGDESTIRCAVSPALRPSDFSNFLGIMMGVDGSDGSSVTIVDSDAFSHAAHEDDLYGWEAELDRKSGATISVHGTDICYCDRFQYRRANGGRRSLLHRVFSLGSASKDDLILPPRQPVTDNLGTPRDDHHCL